ncbi:hypothetical protein DITRI_Ditri04bG0141700 [Diplodiscus trichospermus]
MGKSELTPDQRKAKNELDRRRRGVLETAERGTLFVRQTDENRLLKEENEGLQNENEELKQKLKHKRFWFSLYSRAEEFDQILSQNEEVANNYNQCPGSSQVVIQSQVAIQYTDEVVEDFIKKLDVKEKSNVDFSDFEGLKEEIKTSGINDLPPSLAPFDARINDIFGDIAAYSTQSNCSAMPSRILFYAAIKEMHNLQLVQIDERKILLWRDAINSALNINFKAEL